MTAPAVTLSVTTRHKLKELKLERSQVMPPGKVMYCRDRKVIGFSDVTDLHRAPFIAPRANTVCLSTADFDDVKRWLG